MSQTKIESHGCRENCAACCIAISISSPIPGMENGKVGGIPCIHLTNDYRCAIYDSPMRPAVCRGFSFDKMVCGNTREEALSLLSKLERDCNTQKNG